MTSGIHGAWRVFRAFGVDVHLHWTWFILVLVEWQTYEARGYGHVAWAMLELVFIFAIVTLHEFGHALACKSVGGRASQIVLWPLGGLALVEPPPRPGAMLWSIAAGPLVNVVLALPLIGMAWAAMAIAPDQDWSRLAFFIALINVMLLVFNMLPIYPLDGGQILWSLLWFVLGRAQSLQIAATIGVGFGGLGVVAALAWQAWLLAVIAAFVTWRAWVGLRVARVIRRVEAGEAPGARPDAPTHFVDLDNLPASREVDPERGGRNESRPAD